ncbi:hypothetical protein L2E82_10510 [Cichorium intybus]|uniref:Uncharacterized protein n=1 Tax=Cichorium intybus TaxID=13427 RepID=A0ACB9GBT2_CICIN|nr:hypothetical protein L2E82_10510 [Cichorium intybus]
MSQSGENGFPDLGPLEMKDWQQEKFGFREEEFLRFGFASSSVSSSSLVSSSSSIDSVYCVNYWEQSKVPREDDNIVEEDEGSEGMGWYWLTGEMRAGTFESRSGEMIYSYDMTGSKSEFMEMRQELRDCVM